ncbi:MAG: VRR-NUC domain-containing protein [Peptococcaceae bacterium]|nr:VRR-NUC domain-containing protein [Peptococcaceae bacterium]
MREKLTEQKLVRAVKASGGIALKFVSPGYDGMPDRLVLLPGGRIAFVEVKSHGMEPRPLQVRRHGMLRWLGFLVYVLDDERQIPSMLTEIMGGGVGICQQKTE